ncbi:neuropeptide F-like [Argiope bruennichi]|nr:neuropeptide F-like [Argiope bruennichi]
MMGKFSIILFTITVVAILIVVTLPESGKANPSLEDGINVAEAIRYLEKLDKYYSQIARPRYGRSTDFHKRSALNAVRSKNPAVAVGRR